MTNHMMELRIAATPVIKRIPADKPLPERVQFAMDYVRKHKHDLFWMSAKPDDDMMFRTALAAVMLAGNDEDRDVIARSMQPLKMLSAALSGVPVDFGAMPTDEDLLPLMKFWRDGEAA